MWQSVVFPYKESYTVSSLSFSSDLVKGVHMLVVIYLPRFGSTGKEKRETAHSLKES